MRYTRRRLADTTKGWNCQVVGLAMETTCVSLLVSFPASMFVLFSVNDLGGDGVGVSVNVVILGVVVAVLGESVVVVVSAVVGAIGKKR